MLSFLSTSTFHALNVINIKKKHVIQFNENTLTKYIFISFCLDLILKGKYTQVKKKKTAQQKGYFRVKKATGFSQILR